MASTHSQQAIRATLAASLALLILVAVPAIALAGDISGTVKNAGGAALKDVYAQVWEKKSETWVPSPYIAVTDLHGKYTITGVPTGTYRLSFEDSQNNLYKTAYHSGKQSIDTANDIAVTSAALTGVNATLTAKTVAISGTVREKASGGNLAGIEVVAFLQDSKSGEWTPTTWTTTNSGGAYQLAGLGTGIYRIGSMDWSGRFSDSYFTNALTVQTSTNIVYSGALLTRDLVMVREPVSRLAGQSRFLTAVELAYEQYHNRATSVVDFDGVTSIVIAAGDDRAATDSLAAGGLCYAFQVTKTGSSNVGKGAPMVLVPGSGTVPQAVSQFVVDVAKGDSSAGVTGNGTNRVQLVVVGGTSSLPASRIAAIKEYAAKKGVTVTEKRVAGANRYSTGLEITREMIKAAAGNSRIDAPTFALVANGADPRRFFDALALSPLSAHNGAPILLVSEKAVPSETNRALSELGLAGSNLYVGGGTAAISDSVLSTLKTPKANRLAGRDRYATATAIANRALLENWLPHNGSKGAVGVGIASKLPDALTGGAMAGDADFGYPLLLTAPETLSSDTSSFLNSHRGSIADAFIFGGEASVSSAVESAAEARLR